MDLTAAKNRSFLFLPGLVGFILAFRSCLAILFFRESFSMASVLSTALSLVLLLAAFFSAVGGNSSLPASCYRTPALRWMLVFFTVALVSIAWSDAPIYEASGFWCAWIADVITIWFLMRNGIAEHQAAAVFKGYVWGACIVAVVAWCLPVMPDLRLGDEEFLHPNAIGFVTAVATFMAIHLGHKKKSWRWLAFWLAFTLLRTISKTSIVAFAIAVTVYLFRDKTLTRATKVKIGLAGVVIVAMLWSSLAMYFDNYVESSDPATLTGRTLIWSTAGDLAIEKPIFGHGFYSFHFVVPPLGKFEPAHAHNELLQQFFILGIVGVALVVGIYWVFFTQIRRSPKSDIKTLAMALLIFAVFRGLTDTERNDLSFPLWLMAMLSILLAASQLQPEQPRVIPHLGTEEPCTLQ